MDQGSNRDSSVHSLCDPRENTTYPWGSARPSNVEVIMHPHRTERCKYYSWKEWEPFLAHYRGYTLCWSTSVDLLFLAPFWEVPIRSICVISESNSSFFKPLLATGSAFSIDVGDLPGPVKGYDWHIQRDDINTKQCSTLQHRASPVFHAKLQVLAYEVIQSIFLKTKDKRLYGMIRKSVYFLGRLHRSQ